MTDKIATLKKVAEQVTNGRYTEYSGRGMYGAQCASIYCDNAHECIEAAAAAGIRGARTDSMGRGAVVYWPSIKIRETS